MGDGKLAFAGVCAFIGALPLLFVLDDNPAMILWLLWFVPLASVIRADR